MGSSNMPARQRQTKMLYAEYKTLDACILLATDIADEHPGRNRHVRRNRRCAPSHRLGHGRSGWHQPRTDGHASGRSGNAETARIVVFGDRRILDKGAQEAGVELDLEMLAAPGAPSGERHAMVDLKHLAPDEVERGEATLKGGTFATTNFRKALEMADAGRADGVMFTPFNKKAMRYAYPGYDDEIRFVVDVTGFNGKVREFNVLEKVWNARVTSTFRSRTSRRI